MKTGQGGVRFQWLCLQPEGLGALSPGRSPGQTDRSEVQPEGLRDAFSQPFGLECNPTR